MSHNQIRLRMVRDSPSCPVEFCTFRIPSFDSDSHCFGETDPTGLLKSEHRMHRGPFKRTMVFQEPLCRFFVSFFGRVAFCRFVGK